MTIEVTEGAEKKHSGLIPYKPGQSGNPAGRPKGSRNKLGEDFLNDLHQSWKTHGVSAIERVIEKRPHEYLRVVASILPRQIELNDNLSDLADDELASLLALARAMVDTGKQVGAGISPSGGSEQTQSLPPVQ